ncbi:MAG: MFS transporter [Fusobacteria bacterium]|nr:MFS transporter [Fusobacteriota bacterium]
MVILATIIFLVGVLVLTFANTFMDFFLGRLIQGAGVGIVTNDIPLYLVEIPPSSICGRGMTIFQLLLGVGSLERTLLECILYVERNGTLCFFSNFGDSAINLYFHLLRAPTLVNEKKL